MWFRSGSLGKAVSNSFWKPLGYVAPPCSTLCSNVGSSLRDQQFWHENRLQRETYSDCTHLRIPLPLLTGTKDAIPQILSHQVGFPGRIQEVAIWEFVFNNGTDPFVVHFHMAWNHGQWLTPLSKKNSLRGTKKAMENFTFLLVDFPLLCQFMGVFSPSQNRCHASCEIPTHWAGYKPTFWIFGVDILLMV